MSIFTRSSASAPQPAATPLPETGEPATRVSTALPPPAPGVVAPPAAPLYTMRRPDSDAGDAQRSVAEKVRMAREAQQSVRERVRLAVQRAKGTVSPGRTARAQSTQPCAPAMPLSPNRSFDSGACVQNGLLNLAWQWQQAGAPIRAVHTYVELLTRYPDTPAANAAVTQLVELSEKLAREGQFHAALVIYDHLEQLA